MKCFYHPTSFAVGICKNCSRGICKKCAAEAGDSIACKNRCEEKTKAVVELINRNIEYSGKAVASYGIAAGSYFRFGLWIFLMGALFLICGLYRRDTFLELFGFLCFLGTSFYLYTGYKYKKRP